MMARAADWIDCQNASHWHGERVVTLTHCRLGPFPIPPPREPSKLSSEEILEQANEIIHGERAQSYGPAEESFARIGEFWSSYLGVDVDAYDVAMLMVLMKVSRAKTDVKRDSLVDIAGYAALAERCAVQAGRIDEQH